ncbi:MAG: HlyD family efflux transporter periplasmic adaptor subunit [Phycisphaerae bacterium]|nr:HlyD family efflux transporter periplasmic adaptor subunit [Phycisphaerae bacterium]
MTRFGFSHRFCTTLLCLGCVIVTPCIFTGCERTNPHQLQGYVEGEFVYVASPLAGSLQTLHVQRGAQVAAGDPLFALESTPEKAARDEAQSRLVQARASLEDAKKGRRPSEIESLQAQLAQAEAALGLSEKELARQEELSRSGATTPQDLDRARSMRDQAREKAAQLQADLKTAQLGARSDQIAAAQANVRTLEATVAAAEWSLSQKSQAAPQAGLVFDTMYRQGEWVPAGRPVVALLPPQNIKVRAFVPEAQVHTLHQGDHVQVIVDGASGPLAGQISFISPHAEFTPPVIYSRENRSKLVFMIEVTFDPESAATLHPGQPVDVQLGS